MTRPEAPERLPQKTLLQLWRGPGGVRGRAVEQHSCGIEWARPLRGSSHRSLQDTLPPQQKRQGQCFHGSL